MIKSVLAAALLCALPTVVVAQAEKTDPSSLPEKAMKDQPGVTGAGSTATPTAKPKDGSLSDKAMKDQPGSTGGSTGEPTTQPKSGDLPSKAEEDLGKK